MALKAIVDSLDGVPEALRGEYTQITEGDLNGKFRLSVEPVGGFELDNVTGLKNSLSAARGERDGFEEKLKAYGEITPNKAKEGVTALNKLSKLGGEDVDKIVEERVNTLKGQLIEAHTGEVKTRDDRINHLTGIVTHQLIDSAAKEAILAEKGDPLLLLPHVKQSMKLIEKDGAFSVQIVDPSTGHPRIKDGQGNPMAVKDLVAEMKNHESFARAFEASGKSGTGATGGGGGGGGGGDTGIQRSKMSPAQKGEYIDKHGEEAFLALPM